MTPGPADPEGADLRKRPGFPLWNLAELDYSSPAASGSGSVKLPTRGGSTSIMLETGVLPVFQNADYSISAKVRTEGLTAARARLVARFLDAKQVPIPGSEAAGDFVAGTEWQTTAVELVGAFEHAAFMEIELQLLQPAQQGMRLRGYEALPQDLAGAAWFDSVVVAQLPRIELSTNAPDNIIAAPDRPELKLEVRDLTGESLRTQVVVVDAVGVTVDRLVRQAGTGRSREPWRPKLPAFGWYRAVLGVYNDSGLVGATSADFVWLPEPPRPAAGRTDTLAQRRSFGVVISDDRPVVLNALPEIVRKVGTGSVMFPVWRESLTRAEVIPRLKLASAAIDPMLDAGQDVVLSLARLPSDLADETRVDADDPLGVFTSHAAAAAPYIEPWLEKYGQRVRRWQIGEPGDDRAFWRPTLAAELDTLDSTLGKLVPGPVVVLPWNVERGVSSTVSPARARQTYVSALLPQDAGPLAVEAFATGWREKFAQGPAPELGFVFESVPPERYGYLTPSAELVKRAVEFWAMLGPNSETGRGASGRAAGAWLLNPWTFSDERRARLQPRPELAAWSNLVRQLSDRQIVGAIPVQPGVRAYILAPAPGAPEGRTGAIVAWNESAAPELAVLRANLAPSGGATVVDIFGNVSAAPTESTGSDDPETAGALKVPLTDVPVFIDGLDALLTRFIASVRIEPGLLKAVNASHDHAIVFDNPWTTSIDVKSSLVSPGGFEAESGAKDRRWRIAPRTGRTTVGPGQRGRIPMTISFSPSEESGEKPFVIDLELTADRSYGSIRVTTGLELGLDDVRLELTSVPAGGADALVEAQITNSGKSPLTLELTAFAPGQPKVKSQVSNLSPGSQAVRRFPYGGLLEALRGKRVFVAVTDPGTGARLNRSVEIR